ncbi:hypothetical protein HDU76_008719 [Blyttiomyces sp. JEL0837]|nr:hypothetical protein HDU76_008719 [Blyttiomyces sp. JEL0837]
MFIGLLYYKRYQKALNGTTFGVNGRLDYTRFVVAVLTACKVSITASQDIRRHLTTWSKVSFLDYEELSNMEKLFLLTINNNTNLTLQEYTQNIDTLDKELNLVTICIKNIASGSKANNCVLKAMNDLGYNVEELLSLNYNELGIGKFDNIKNYDLQQNLKMIKQLQSILDCISSPPSSESTTEPQHLLTINLNTPPNIAEYHIDSNNQTEEDSDEADTDIISWSDEEEPITIQPGHHVHYHIDANTATVIDSDSGFDDAIKEAAIERTSALNSLTCTVSRHNDDEDGNNENRDQREPETFVKVISQPRDKGKRVLRPAEW